MWYYIHLGDVEIRRTSTLKTASRVGNLNLVNYGFKTINGNKLVRDAVAMANAMTQKVSGALLPSTSNYAGFAQA